MDNGPDAVRFDDRPYEEGDACNRDDDRLRGEEVATREAGSAAKSMRTIE